MKLDFTQPPPRPKTHREAQDIINVLWRFCGELSKRIDEQQKIIEAQQKTIEAQQKTIETQQKEIEELKEKLNRNSNNSSKPPSSEPFKKKFKKKKKSKRKQGAQPGHKAVFRKLLPEDEIDHIEKHYPSKRCNCGSRIKPTGTYRRHQVYELPRIKATVTEHQLYAGICFGCGRIHQAELPVGVPRGMLYRTSSQSELFKMPLIC